MRILSIIVFSIISFNFLSERSIHNRWSIELLKFVDENGQVDYVNWSKNRVGLDAYISTLKKNHPKPHWTKNQIMSYWIIWSCFQNSNNHFWLELAENL